MELDIGQERYVRILILTDDLQLVELFSVGFLYEGFEAVVARTNTEAIENARKRRPDVVLIAVPIPMNEVPNLCKALRSQNNVGVLLLGVTPQLDAWPGDSLQTPDGYLPAPVTFRDTFSLTCQTLKSRNINVQRVLRAGDIILDRQTLRVHCQGQEAKLTLCELNLLELFLLHPGQVFSSEAIFARVWGYDYYGRTNAVGVSVGNLRRKLGTCGSYIRTVRKAGYAFEPPGSMLVPEGEGT